MLTGRMYLQGMPPRTLARVPLAGGARREVALNVLGAEWPPDGRGLAVARDDEITSDRIHTPPTSIVEGVGIVEAPRGILTHHYKTDAKGFVKEANLIVGTIWLARSQPATGVCCIPVPEPSIRSLLPAAP